MLRPYQQINRRKSRVIKVGNVSIGGNNQIAVQTMTNTLTSNAKDTIAQIERSVKLGVDLVPIHCDWDNTFPNHPPDPTRQKNMVDLSRAVVENNCEFGIGMDGDGDRIGVVDEQGRFIHPDRLMALIAADVLVDRRDGTEAERTVFFDVKCSMALEEAILASGGVPKMVRTGHSFMKRELRSNPEAVMAGEMSGHFFLHDRWPGFDCSLYNAARLLEIIGRDPAPNDGGVSFSHRFANLPDYPSTDETKIPLVAGREETMEAVEGAFADMEKFLVLIKTCC